MKLYTRQGDKGTTALFGGSCVRKDDPQVVCYGAIDALNAQLGLVSSSPDCPTLIFERIQKIQHRIFDMGSYVALSPDASKASIDLLPKRISEEDVKTIENWIDESEAELAPLKTFVLPGGHPVAAQMHVVRVTCRHAEGLLITLHEAPTNGPLKFVEELQYINRLSDLFFSWARYINKHHQMDDVCWTKAT